MVVLLGLLVVTAAVVAVVRGVDVRLALFLAALALGVLTGDPSAVVRKFFSTLAAEEFLIPICTAMGFAHVLRHTGCDRHLVQMLVSPLRRVEILLIPGAVLVGFIVNVPIVSQTSTAAAVGAVLVPLMRAAGVSPITAGSTLLLGTSLGGALLNQGAPEFRTVIRETAALGLPAPSGTECVQAVLPLAAVHLAVTTLAFWLPTLRRRGDGPLDAALASPVANAPVQVSYAKAVVPLIPLALLFLVAPPLKLIEVPQAWLVGAREPATLLRDAAAALGDPRLRDAAPSPFDSRLVGAAMIFGVLVAALTQRRAPSGVVCAFFEGAGFALTQIISIIVAAACFGEGVKLLGLHRLIGSFLMSAPGLLVPAAGLIPLGFGFVSGSGMAATQSLFGLFAAPSLSLGVATDHVGAVVALGAAAGRTLSPVAAVALMCASLTSTRSTHLVRRVAVPVLLGVVTMAVVASLMANGLRGAPAAGSASTPVVGRAH